MYTATLSNMTMHYNRMGSGETLVFIHGLSERKEGWACQYELANEYDLVIPDLRGHGQSTDSGDISIQVFAQDILCLLDTLGVENAHICGISMGGVVAQELYRIAPDRCRSLILVSSFYTVPRLWRLPLYYSWMWRATLLPPVFRQSLAALTCLTDWKDETLSRFYNAFSRNHSSYQKTLAACLNIDNSDLLPQIQVPTLVIGSDRDLLTPPWIQAMMHDLIKNSQLVIFHHAGHMAKLEQPAEFNRVIREFLHNQRNLA